MSCLIYLLLLCDCLGENAINIGDDNTIAVFFCAAIPSKEMNKLYSLLLMLCRTPLFSFIHAKGIHFFGDLLIRLGFAGETPYFCRIKPRTPRFKGKYGYH